MVGPRRLGAEFFNTIDPKRSIACRQQRVSARPVDLAQSPYSYSLIFVSHVLAKSGTADAWYSSDACRMSCNV